MRVLGVRTHSYKKEDPDYISPVDMWRVQRPLEALRKNTNWKIDIVTEWVNNKSPLDRQLFNLAHSYDIIYTSYIREGLAFSYLKVICKKYGLIHVMDIDDYLMEIPDFNPAKLYLNKNTREYQDLMTIIREADNLSVTTKPLQEAYKKLRGDKPIKVLPNYISTEFYQNKKKDNGNNVVIGYVGTSTHYIDFHQTGFLKALQNVLRIRPNAIFHSVGMPVLDFKLPKGQFKFTEGASGFEGWKKLYSELDFDINTTPLVNNQFNACKSDLKYQEGALMHVPTIFGRVGCYCSVAEDITGLKAGNQKEWEEKLLYLIDNPKRRQEIAEKAENYILNFKTLEKNWTVYKNYFEGLYASHHQKTKF